MHSLDLGLYSDLKGFLGNRVRTHANSEAKILSAGDSEEGRTSDAASRKTASPRHY